MAVTHSPAGYTGTVDQVDEARRFALGGGGRFRVLSTTDWAPTASASVNRTVNIAAGTAAACGVLDITTAVDSVAFATNTGGTDRFDAVVATFDWAALTVTFRVVQGTSVPPAVVRTGTTVDATKINWLPGTRYDAVIAIIRVRPSVALLAPADLYDCRPWGDWRMLNVASATYIDQIDADAGARVRDSGGTTYQKQTDGTWAYATTVLDHATGRVALATTTQVATTTALTATVTLTAIPVASRIVVEALGRTGFSATAEQVGWDWDTTPASATNLAKDYDGASQITTPSSGWAGINASLSMDLPASVVPTFRLILRTSGPVYNRGALIWHRIPLT